MILTILFIFFCIRLISLKISMQHAKQLKVEGAVEYGVKNSKYLAITHVFIYMSAAIETFIHKDTFSLLNGIGLIILIVAYIMLFIVIKTLGRIWTLIGVLRLTHATYTTLLLVPYAYFLIARIRQEENLMNI